MCAFRPLAWVMALSLAAATPLLAQQAPAATAPNLGAYAGHYELAPGATLTVTSEGGHLFAQLTGQDKYEIFPDGPNEFAWMVVDAKVSFERSLDGKTTGATIHQNGMDVPAKRAD